MRWAVSAESVGVREPEVRVTPEDEASKRSFHSAWLSKDSIISCAEALVASAPAAAPKPSRSAPRRDTPRFQDRSVTTVRSSAVKTVLRCVSEGETGEAHMRERHSHG
ncbi:hypothetical protein GCM10008171_06190 [Methylopila jiangsuensis]|uniref:Uncharacterized protein n=1 Tax=Methylopila jiangsuensis TaxID=586230 RepID=A0A9W6JGF1_9HYPH|nr:hypothetical protein GCM10008171_06190 [Methylopila jiangsuensis]